MRLDGKWFSLQGRSAGQCVLSLPPWEGEGEGPSPLERGREGEGGGGVLPPSASPAWSPAMRRALARAVMTPLAPSAEHCAAGWRWHGFPCKDRQLANVCCPSPLGRGGGGVSPPSAYPVWPPARRAHPRGQRARVGHVPVPPLQGSYVRR